MGIYALSSDFGDLAQRYATSSYGASNLGSQIKEEYHYRTRKEREDRRDLRGLSSPSRRLKRRLGQSYGRARSYLMDKEAQVNNQNEHYNIGRRATNLGVALSPAVLGAGLGYALGGTKHKKAVAGLGLIAGGLAGRKLLGAKQRRDVRKGKMLNVKSSMIKNIIDTPHGVYIKFNTGKVYRFPNLSAKDRKALMNAESAGKYFNQHIKGKYRYERL